MKSAFSLGLITALFSFSALATSPDLICNTTLPDMGEGETQFEINIFVDGDSGRAEIASSIGGVALPTMKDKVTVLEGQIRENLAEQVEANDLSLIETIVAHAMATTQDPDLKDFFSVGDVDLNKVQYTLMYIVGEMSDMGAMVVIEAFDQNMKPLGNFVGGFVVRPCE